MNKLKPTVFVVDDDAGVLRGINILLKSVELDVETYSDAQKFLENYDPDQPGCLILDVRMPKMSGIELQQKLMEKNLHIPVIFVSGHGDVPLTVKAMQRGAVDFIEKPFNDQVLLDQVQKALEKDAQIRKQQTEKKAVLECFDSLTPKERQIMHMVADGKLNKVIAHELQISQKTVEYHRANMMRKMQADSLAQLVKSLSHANVLQ